jgi:formylglycine-generating enzyme required for sulfatase activity
MSEPANAKKLQVFLCHSSGDKEEIRALYHQLLAEGWITPWLDEEELVAGQDWREEIEKAVEQSHIILVCLSPASITKEGYVQREIRVALDHADYMPEGTIYIIPLKLKECEPPRRLIRWHWVNYFEERGYERLLRGLRLRAEKLGIEVNSNQAQAPRVRQEAVINPPKPSESLPKPKTVEKEREQFTPQSREDVVIDPPKPIAQPPKPPELSEPEKLLRELENRSTTHERRRDIGIRLAEIGDIRPGVGVRADGLPDIVWLPVTPGGNITLEIDKKPQTFQVAPFYIAKYPVTFVQYEAFFKAKDGFDNPQWWEGMPKQYQRQELEEQVFKGLTNPRDNVSWYQSVAFARWLNHQLQGQSATIAGSNTPLTIGQNAEVRLPLEWEWQWAAQGGSEKRKYPWGQWQAGYANTYEAGLQQTIAVGMYPHGAAICEAMDMSGQLWEWCANKYSSPKNMLMDNGTRVVRGGSFIAPANDAACAFRGAILAYDHFRSSGFRLVVSAPE